MARQLLHLEGLGDRRPTELLRYMRTLHQADKGDILFMALFLQQMPPSLRTILAATEYDDIDDMARAADAILAEQGDTLKRRLIRVFAPSQDERAARLLHMPAVADASPAQTMSNMLALLGDHKDCPLFRRLFMEQLPEDIRQHVLQSGKTDYRDMADVAERFFLDKRAASLPGVPVAVAAPSSVGRKGHRLRLPVLQDVKQRRPSHHW
jgi:hypothetical protein